MKCVFMGLMAAWTLAIAPVAQADPVAPDGPTPVQVARTHAFAQFLDYLDQRQVPYPSEKRAVVAARMWCDQERGDITRPSMVANIRALLPGVTDVHINVLKQAADEYFC
jgi:hypothetical protein